MSFTQYTGFVGVLDFLESPWILKFIFKAWKLLEFSCFGYNVLESPWKREKHRMFFKLIVLNYVKLLNFRHWWCSDYCRQRTVFITPKTEHSGIGPRFIHCFLFHLQLIFTRRRRFRSGVRMMCLWISDWLVDLMILSHVRGKKLKVQTHTWGTPQIINFFG